MILLNYDGNTQFFIGYLRKHFIGWLKKNWDQVDDWCLDTIRQMSVHVHTQMRMRKRTWDSCKNMSHCVICVYFNLYKMSVSFAIRKVICLFMKKWDKRIWFRIQWLLLAFLISYPINLLLFINPHQKRFDWHFLAFGLFSLRPMNVILTTDDGLNTYCNCNSSIIDLGVHMCVF